MEIKHVERFWNHLANQNYKESLVGWYDQHCDDPNEKNVLFGGIEPNKNALALDFGCGPGRNMIKFHDWFGRIDGADISSVILEKAVLDLTEKNIPIPNLYHIDGKSLPNIKDSTYDVVFSIICHQHIGDRSWRLSLYKEFFRVLKPGGILTFQTGFGNHPISVDYFHEYTQEDENEGRHFDVRVENPNDLKIDLEQFGFTDINFITTDPCHDQHDKWLWTKCVKPLN